MLGALLKEARPKQWVKNILVFAAPGAAGVLDNGSFAADALVAFVAFCLVASGTYYVNDLLDVEADRLHPKKRFRPIAGGRIPIPLAWVVAAILLAAGMGLAFVVRWQFAVVVGIYVALTLSYSTLFKHIAVVDLCLVAAGFVIRAVGGAVAVDVPMSTWFLLCVSFGSLFIVTGKRYAELRELGDGASNHRATLDEYSLGYLRIVLSVAMAATLVSYCIWAFDTKEISGSTWPFYELSILPMLMAILRYALVLEQGQGAAPEEIFLADRTLQILGVLWVIVFALGVYVG